MAQILSSEQAIKTAEKLKKNNKVIVIAGGYFDILHVGHIKFLEAAKKEGDALFVLVESDESAKKIKGEKRPINPQKTRCLLLSTLKSVDIIIPLPYMTNNQEYDTLMASIGPKVIATTQSDPNVKHKERQANKIGGKVKFVIGRIKNISSTRLAELIEK